MDKQTLISTVSESLTRLGVPCSLGGDTDIKVAADFIDTRWSTGEKKIRYAASVFFDAKKQTVFMHEKTVESGGGLSFGTQGESSFQTGKTLMRKVKSIQYGPEGKAVEYELDLGAVAKTVKEAAGNAGWKFKTVIRKKNAMRPSGSAGQTSLPATGSTAGDAPIRSEGTKPIRLWPGRITFVILIGLALLALMALLGVKAPWGGWLTCGLLLGGAFVANRKIARMGWLAHLGLGSLAALLLFIALVVFLPDGGGLTTATIKNPVVTAAVDKAGKPRGSVTSFPTDAPQLAVSAELRHAPRDTTVRFVWTYLPLNYEIASFDMSNADRGTDIYVFSTLINEGKPWPVGEYRVDFFVDNSAAPDAAVNFKVE